MQPFPYPLLLFGFCWQEGFSFLDAFYFTFVTFTTIGLGDFVPSSSLGWLWLILFASVGLGLLAALLGVIEQAWVASNASFLEKVSAFFARNRQGTAAGGDADVIVLRTPKGKVKQIPAQLQQQQQQQQQNRKDDEGEEGCPYRDLMEADPAAYKMRLGSTHGAPLTIRSREDSNVVLAQDSDVGIAPEATLQHHRRSPSSKFPKSPDTPIHLNGF